MSTLLLFNCTSNLSKKQEQNTENATVGITTTTVATAFSAFSTLAYTVHSSGRIQPHFTELLLSERSGLLLTCRAYNNQAVKKDEIIATIKSTALDLRHEKLLIQQYNAQKEYKSQLLGYENLLKGKSPRKPKKYAKNYALQPGCLA